MTSSPPSSGLSPAVSTECPAELLATEDRGCARCGTLPNISRHELTTTMHHLSLLLRREVPVKERSAGCQGLVRFFALLRIKPHAPPLVRVPVNSFEFHSCERTPQVEYLMRLLRHRSLATPTPSAHRLRCGLPGYLILFAPHTFVPQCQLQSRKPPSPLVFLLISTHFTATLGIPLTSPAL